MSIIDEQNYDKPFSFSVYKKLFPFYKPYKIQFALAIIMMIFSSIIDASIPLFQKYALDTFVLENSKNGIIVFGLMYFLVIILQFFVILIFSINTMKVDLGLAKDMKRALFIKLQELSFSFYNKTPVGYTYTRIMSDTVRISAAVSWDIVDMIWQFSYVLSVFIAMLFLNVKLAMIVMTVIPIIAIITYFFQGKMLKFNRKVSKINSKISNGYNEGITGDKTSKTLVIEELNYSNFEKNTKEMYKASLKSATLNALFIPIIIFISSFVMAMILSGGSEMVAEDIIKIGTLSVFITFALSIFEPIQNLARHISTIITMQSYIERVFDLLEKDSEIVDTPEVIEKYGSVFEPKVTNFEKIKGDIEFMNVWFKYPDGHEYVLEDFSLKIKAGTTVALVGETGSGKSTLINLACRFFEPTKGSVLIDGIDYKERSLLWLHSNIGYVLQTPHLFSGTIYKNIRYGKLDATFEEVDKATKSVSADLVINKLEKGYESEVYESGESLSTGEKQLISFARAILTDPSIFVLDEATSSIDTKTEALIQEATDHLLADRTSFVIAHRLSTIKKADLILVIKDGKVFEQGTHLELLEKEGYYYNLYKNQFEEDKSQEFLNK